MTESDLVVLFKPMEYPNDAEDLKKNIEDLINADDGFDGLVSTLSEHFMIPQALCLRVSTAVGKR